VTRIKIHWLWVSQILVRSNKLKRKRLVIGRNLVWWTFKLINLSRNKCNRISRSTRVHKVKVSFSHAKIGARKWIKSYKSTMPIWVWKLTKTLPYRKFNHLFLFSTRHQDWLIQLKTLWSMIMQVAQKYARDLHIQEDHLM